MKIIWNVLIITALTYNVHASLHSFTFNGQVSTIIDNQNDVLGSLIPGDSFSGTFTYSDTPDTEPWPTSGQYNQQATLDLNLGSNTFIYDGNMNIATADGPSSDFFEYWTDESFGDWNMLWYGFEFEDTDQTALSDDSLPTSFNVADYTDPIFRLVGSSTSSGDQFHIVMEVQNISPIPEPSTISMLGLASGIVWIIRRKTNRTSG